VAWLERTQQDDGGWGEDLRSYRDPAWIGRGEPTASQTAWALLALHAAGERGPAVQRGVRWLVEHQLPDGTWDEQRMGRLLAAHPEVVVSGTVDNQGRFYDRFEHVVLLSAPLDVLLERVRTRQNNPYGKTIEQQEEMARYLDEVEPLLRRGASLELDGRRPVAELADVLEELLTGRP
jgi:hypothetical protein